MASSTSPNQDPTLKDDPLKDIGGEVSLDSTPSSIGAQYNSRNPAVKRLLREALEMGKQEDPHILHATPLEDNLFEWHFTFRGPPDTVYSRGVYHGRVIFPSQYPLSPPEIILLTPNGRFETGTKICLSISNYHPETWLPSWGIRTAITALRSFMATDTPGAIGSMECTDQVRKQMANNSLNFKCQFCGPTTELLRPIPSLEINQEDISASKEDGNAPKTLQKEPNSKFETETSGKVSIENDHNHGESGDTIGVKEEKKQSITETKVEQQADAEQEEQEDRDIIQVVLQECFVKCSVIQPDIEEQQTEPTSKPNSNYESLSTSVATHDHESTHLSASNHHESPPSPTLPIDQDFLQPQYENYDVMYLFMIGLIIAAIVSLILRRFYMFIA